MALLAVLVSSCKHETLRYELTEAARQSIPYELGQVVTFIDSAHQAIDVTVTADEVYWTIPEDSELGRYSVTLESRIVRLQSEYDNLDIRMQIFAMNIINGDIYSKLSIKINSNYFWAPLCFDNVEEQFVSYGGIQYFHDSLEINNKMYYDVIEDPSQLYYNRTHGILQIRKDEKSVLTIKH